MICRDFNREIWLELFSSVDLECPSLVYPSSFTKQLIQCCQLFQSSQIQTIQFNLHCFGSHQQNRQFRKNLQRMKSQILNEYLQECQIQALFPTDRHLLHSDLFSNHFHLSSLTRTRCGTFHNQDQYHREHIQHMLTNGSFCLTCSGNEPICSICTLLRDPSSFPSSIHLGTIKAPQSIRMDCVYGQISSEIRNSCFAHRFLLKLIDSSQFSLITDFVIPSSSPSIRLPKEIFVKLQEFACRFHLQVRFTVMS